MQSSIIFLGTGGDSFVVGKQTRASGGIVIQVEDDQFVIDPGPGTLTRAREKGINLRATTAILVSNSTINHCNDVNAVISAMTYDGFDVKGVLIANSTVINGDGEGTTPFLTRKHKRFVERVITVKPGQRVGIENVEIQALKAVHEDKNAVGFKLFTSGFVVAYTSDTKYSKEIVEQYGKSDIIIFNTCFPSGTKEKERNSLSADEVKKILEKTKPRLAILTHFGHKMLESDPLYEAREIQKATGVQVLAATDGMVVNPMSYSANLHQKTLNLYKESNESGTESSSEQKKTEEPESDSEEGKDVEDSNSDEIVEGEDEEDKKGIIHDGKGENQTESHESRQTTLS